MRRLVDILRNLAADPDVRAYLDAFDNEVNRIMTLLSREAILAAEDVKTEEVEVPEWGGSVLVKGLTGADRDALEASVMVLKGQKQSLNLTNYRARLVACCIVDETGARIFSPGDLEALGRKSAAALDRVAAAARRLSGISDEDEEELAKN